MAKLLNLLIVDPFIIYLQRFEKVRRIYFILDSALGVFKITYLLHGVGYSLKC
jgi:hypothetical protein